MMADKFISPEDFFKRELNPSYTCIKCGNLLLDSYQSSCGCFRCCSSCNFDQEFFNCEHEFKFQPDKAFSKQLKNVKLNCPFNECDTKVTYETYMIHINQCDYRMIECKDCHKKFPMCHLSGHKSDKCDFLVKKCIKCRLLVKYSATKHLEFDERTPPDCNELYANCLNCDAKNVQLRKHYDHCTMIPCFLKTYGCGGLVQSRKCSLVYCHTKFIEQVISSYQINLLEYTNCPENQKIKITSEELSNLTKEVENIRDILQKNLDIYHSLRNGKYVWCISDARNWLNTRQSILSETMYSDEYGYKLCLKVYPGGDGLGKNKYFSVYYVILKGPYDELLSWPFNKNVKITIYNQIDFSKSKIELYKPDLRSCSTQKPKYDMNVATGNPTFISLDELEVKGFILDNTMFIELSVSNDKTFL